MTAIPSGAASSIISCNGSLPAYMGSIKTPVSPSKTLLGHKGYPRDQTSTKAALKFAFDRFCSVERISSREAKDDRSTQTPRSSPAYAALAASRRRKRRPRHSSVAAGIRRPWNRIIEVVRILSAFFFSALFAAGTATDRGPAAGAQIPKFSLRDQTGKLQTFDSVKGPKGAIIVFYRSADW